MSNNLSKHKTYGDLHYDKQKNVWVFDNVKPHVCIKIKQVFDGIKKTSICPFEIKSTPAMCMDIEWFIWRFPMVISNADKSFLESQVLSHKQLSQSIEEILLPNRKFKKLELKKGMYARDYQIAFNNVFDKVKRILCGDDIGLGKTIEGILPLLDKEKLPGLFVVQTHLPFHWKEQLQKFVDLDVHFIKQRKPYPLPEADVYVIKYSSLSGWVDLFKTYYFKYVCFDEVQELRRSSSDKYQSAKILSEFSEYVLGLSATPIYNYGDEIYSILQLIKPGCLGDFESFSREWTGNSNTVQDPQALGTYLRDNYLMIRRKREDVGRELPPVNKVIQNIEHNDELVGDIDELAKKLAIKVVSGSFVERGQAGRELDILLRQSTGVGKAHGVAALIKMILDASHKVLVGLWHREVYKILNEQLAMYNPLMYTGTETPNQKNKAKNDFIEGKSNLLLMSLRSGAGLDGLQNVCDTIVYGELDYSPKVHEQFNGRLARDRDDGKFNNVTAYYCISDFGSDPSIVKILGLKETQSHGIMNPYSDLGEVYSDESRIKMIAQHILDKK